MRYSGLIRRSGAATGSEVLHGSRAAAITFFSLHQTRTTALPLDTPKEFQLTEKQALEVQAHNYSTCCYNIYNMINISGVLESFRGVKLIVLDRDKFKFDS